MNTLPAHFSFYFLLFFLVSTLLCILLPFLLLSWRFFQKATAHDLQNLAEESPTEMIFGLCLGLFLSDTLLYVAERSLLPKLVFYIILGTINLLIGSFIGYHVFNRILIWVKQSALVRIQKE